MTPTFCLDRLLLMCDLEARNLEVTSDLGEFPRPAGIWVVKYSGFVEERFVLPSVGAGSR
ncbi:hypothetical protein [Chamaesiphon sp. VAR_69_metabat_338]|uniref:hypothetical protein n=1 Tax=Chamaesiphon sp. VAR_69_metabat_338 TaxID=2964704 RepID=UPI00286DE5C1|nr:hypothetical protein [Chamaesiphon sp. VAR_69_metabat_338]